MCKRFFCILLTLVMLSSTFTHWLYFAGYKLNKSHIATALCINKNKPALHCQGKCFLKKKLAEAEQKQQDKEHQTQKDLLQPPLAPATFEVYVFRSVVLKIYTPYTNQHLIKRTNAVFRPPQRVLYLV
ncbi:hypothetical protein BCY91_09665 [Pelobium manganitolerans]|uniref:Uncharacterized protein n=2 Tax=Pelobium manganitolerans TaxID=1842495 RepID=A0A419S3G1_9SPHI|nr:hypothetical protein BCY91_09665 [Pelobium manganitolerans]